MKRFRPALTILWLTVFFVGIAILFSNQFHAMGDFIAQRFGFKGLFVTTFLLDFLIQPFPPDIPLYSFVLSDSPFYLAVLGTGVASLCGAMAGYWTGRLLEYEGAIRFIGEKKYKQAHDLFMRHGMLAVMVAALTPVPFNVVCWSAGIFKMPFDRFLLSAVVTRVPRFFLVGWLALAMG